MRTRAAVLIVLLLAALTACSDDGDKPDDAAKEPTAKTSDITNLDCTEFASTANKIAEAQQSLYGSDAAQRQAAVETLTSQLKALKSEAPADVDAALDELLEGFTEASSLMDDPAAADTSKIAEMAPALSDAGQRVTAWIASRCK